MSKHKYRATFKDGTTTTRTSHRDYAAAWRYRRYEDDALATEYFGFARTRDLAWKAVRAEERRASKGRSDIDRNRWELEVADAVVI